jgi:hypothetical protein
MIPIARYALADYLRSQRFLAPLVGYLGILAIFYASPPGPILSAYGLTAALILPISAWLSMSLHNAEDPLQATITVVNAGGFRRVLAGKTLAAVTCLVVLTVTALVWPMISHTQLYSPADVTAGFTAHLTCGLVGIALGMCCTRPIIKRQGYAFATAFLLSMVGLIDRSLMPANETIRLLNAVPTQPPIGELVLLAGGAVLMLVVLAALVTWVAQRRR